MSETSTGEGDPSARASTLAPTWPPLTTRSLSLSHRPRVATRVASPAMQKRLRDVSVPVKAVADAAVEDRLAALEQQVIQEHAYKLELVQAVQNLQAVAAAGQQKLEVHDSEAEVNRAEHLELRRELFAMRDQLSEKLTSLYSRRSHN